MLAILISTIDISIFLFDLSSLFLKYYFCVHQSRGNNYAFIIILDLFRTVMCKISICEGKHSVRSRARFIGTI